MQIGAGYSFQASVDTFEKILPVGKSSPFHSLNQILNSGESGNKPENRLNQSQLADSNHSYGAIPKGLDGCAAWILHQVESVHHDCFDLAIFQVCRIDRTNNTIGRVR